jgi:hypothetical protein
MNLHRFICRLILLTIMLFISCSTPEKQNSNSCDTKAADVQLPFAGCWVSEDYVNNIHQFKSPKKAQDNAQFIIIPDKTLQRTRMVYNFHDGGPDLEVIKTLKGFELWQIVEDSLVSINNSIEIISETKIRIGQTPFVKVDAVKEDNTELIVEELLVKGVYLTIDGKKAEFKKDGSLSGLDEFHHYRVVTDYYDKGLQVDQISLGKSENDGEWFGFRFNNDTFKIYQLNCIAFDSTPDDCNEVEFGELRYKLIKLK